MRLHKPLREDLRHLLLYLADHTVSTLPESLFGFELHREKLVVVLAKDLVPLVEVLSGYEGYEVLIEF